MFQIYILKQFLVCLRDVYLCNVYGWSLQWQCFVTLGGEVGAFQQIGSHITMTEHN